MLVSNLKPGNLNPSKQQIPKEYIYDNFSLKLRAKIVIDINTNSKYSNI